MTVEDTIDEINIALHKIENKLKEKQIISKVNPKKNSHLHIMINTEEKKKLMQKAENEGLDFSKWCRRKLKEDSQLDRIENKLDIILNKKLKEN